jgi:hypothetical protein
MNNTVPTVSSNRNLDNITFPGQTIVHQGIVSSEKPTHVTLPLAKNLMRHLFCHIGRLEHRIQVS